MLAEIFIVRLEAAAGGSAIPASNSRFVPFSPAGPLELKMSTTSEFAAVTKPTRSIVHQLRQDLH